MNFAVLKLKDVVAHRVSTDRAAQGAEFEEPGWWTSIVYTVHYIEQKDWVRRRDIFTYIRFTPATQRGLYRGGPLYLSLLYVLAAAYF